MQTITPSLRSSTDSIRRHDATPPVPLPEGHIGPVVLPGTNRHIWWTGRVAIGIRYERNAERAAVGDSALWVQDLMLASRRSEARHPGIPRARAA